MQIGFPTIGEYNQLIQKKGGDAFRSLKGMMLIPVRTRPIKVFLFGSGAFAAVFKGNYNGKTYAIRCFLAVEKNAIERNKIICDYIKKINSSWKTDCEFIDDEIMINGKSYPILKMEWVEGNLINNFVTKHLNNNNLLSEIQEQLVDISNDLESLEIGHGDLQCGNIIITGDSSKFQIRLIDYDGMYVPELANKKSIETGRSEFQHPKRDKNFYNKEIDRFSFWVMLTALEALKYDKSLWLEVMQGGFNTLDNFLFTVQDFLNPNQSKLFNRLYKINSFSLNFYLDKLKWFCNNEISLITSPELESHTLKINNTPGSKVIPNSDFSIKALGEDLLKDKYKIISINGTAAVLTSSFEKIGDTPLELDKNIYQGKTIVISNGLEIKQVLLTSQQNLIEVEFSVEKQNQHIDGGDKKKENKIPNEGENSKHKKAPISNKEKIIIDEKAKRVKEEKQKEESDKKALEETANLEMQKVIRDEVARLENERELREKSEKKALEEAAKLNLEQKKKKRESKRFNFYVILGILFIAVMAFSIDNFGIFCNNDDSENAPEKPKEIQSHSEIIKNLLIAEENRDFKKIYSHFSTNMSRYWDLDNPSYNNLKKRYEYIWGFTKNSKNYVEKIEKISDNTYDLYTKFEYYNLNKKNTFSTNSIIRYVFGSDRKIIKTYGLEEIAIPKKTITNKIFYDIDWKVCTQSNAEYFRIITLDDKGKPIEKVRDYFISGELQWEGQLTYVDKYNTQNDIMDGKCVWYYKNGNKMAESTYKDGELNGGFADYYENGEVKAKGIYLNGELWGQYIRYSEEGNEIVENNVFKENENSSDFKTNKTFSTTLKFEGKLRDEPTPMSSVIKYIPAGASIKVIAYQEGYYKVSYKYQEGYINEMYLVETYDMLTMKN